MSNVMLAFDMIWHIDFASSLFKASFCRHAAKSRGGCHACNTRKAQWQEEDAKEALFGTHAAREQDFEGIGREQDFERIGLAGRNMAIILGVPLF